MTATGAEVNGLLVEDRDWAKRGRGACGAANIYRLDPVARTIVHWPMWCKAWECGPCAIRKAEPYLAQARRVFKSEPAIWVADSADADRARGMMKERRHRVGAASLTVTRMDGERRVARYFSDSDLGGTKPPCSGVWVTAEEAVGLFREAFRLPGVDRAPRWCGAWKDRAEQRDDDGVRLRRPLIALTQASGERWDGSVFPRAQDMAEQIWGERPTEDYVPPEIDPASFVAVVQYQARRLAGPKRGFL